MSDLTQLEEVSTWDDLWEKQKAEDAGLVLIFKASPICPVSHAVENNFKKFLDSHELPAGASVYTVDVVNQRPISQKIASDTGVKHESPQALVIGPGQEIVWHASHYGVGEASLQAALGL